MALLAFTTSLVLSSRTNCLQPASTSPRFASRQRAALARRPATMVQSGSATPSNAPASPDDSAPAATADASSLPPVRITGNNIPLTDSLREYVDDKLSKVVRRFGSLLTKVDVHLTVEHNPSIKLSNKAEVVAFAGKTILRNEVREADMYVAIDEVEGRIARTIRKYKERRVATVSKAHYAASSPRSSKTGGTRRLATIPGVTMPDDASFGEDDDDAEAQAASDEFRDVYAGEETTLGGVPKVEGIVRRKVFPMPLQTVEEAVLCCEYVDHPWYLFRNAETKEICLVYRRNHGGYGLIEPSNPESVDDEEVL